MDDKKTIREIIEQRISAAGMSKRDFAKAIGRTAGSLNDLLSSPSWPSLEKMASVLGISVAELVSDGEPHSTHTATCPHCGHEIEITIELK
jgi:ribosome-binding protein aMBF1 (putative translation factor)